MPVGLHQADRLDFVHGPSGCCDRCGGPRMRRYIVFGCGCLTAQCLIYGDVGLRFENCVGCGEVEQGKGGGDVCRLLFEHMHGMRSAMC